MQKGAYEQNRQEIEEIKVKGSGGEELRLVKYQTIVIRLNINNIPSCVLTIPDTKCFSLTENIAYDDTYKL